MSFLLVEFADRLADITYRFENGDTPREIIEVLDAHVGRLLTDNVGSQAVSVGAQVPGEQVAYSADGAVDLMSLCRDRYLVMTWFRGNW